MNPTGILQRAPYRFGEHQAFFVLGGEPLPGDEVILPGDSSFDGLLARFAEDSPDAEISP